MTARIILYSGLYSVALCRKHPDLWFVFGDNALGFGKGGQAIIRDEPNAVGVPTKRRPSMAPVSFFEEGNTNDLDVVLHSIGGLWRLLREGNQLVVPVTPERKVSLGLGLARLNETAPTIYQTISLHVDEMIAAHGGRDAENSANLID